VQDAERLNLLVAELSKLSAEDRARLAAILAAGAGEGSEVAQRSPLDAEP
jgi:hypothetical protein